jgi:hypothetical protein
VRFLKRVLICVLIYAAVYLPFIAILQAVSLADYTAAYTVGGITASVEMILCALIKREETKFDNKQKEKQNELGRNDSVDNHNAGVSGVDNSSGGIAHQGITREARGNDK